MVFTYKTSGVCAESLTIDVDNGIVNSVEFDGGCDGNAKGISKLVVGMSVPELINRLGGIRCGRKKTSCPDQLAKALADYNNANEPEAIRAFNSESTPTNI